MRRFLPLAALLGVALVLGCQDLGSGPVGPDGLLPQFHHGKGSHAGGGSDGDAGRGRCVTFRNGADLVQSDDVSTEYCDNVDKVIALGGAADGGFRLATKKRSTRRLRLEFDGFVFDGNETASSLKLKGTDKEGGTLLELFDMRRLPQSNNINTLPLAEGEKLEIGLAIVFRPTKSHYTFRLNFGIDGGGGVGLGPSCTNGNSTKGDKVTLERLADVGEKRSWRITSGTGAMTPGGKACLTTGEADVFLGVGAMPFEITIKEQ